eukprot:TRINITY_DN20432_c0_g1::TRINITY_DN20432_c0_g1_i1::g.8442::m.8442 TRINITY_DN20432_c0_g1::TRINITY_DN20432_c0_g1_i1::g.8442  ORF type:complete len:106 (+),score=4.53,sp/Q5ZJI6/NATD1_CHICK/36.05/2e-09,Acetyltransf_CG/PF14542.1/4.6e-24,Acetyltransf_10/PF13673.1/0.00069,Acetyltransf_7/PF13508.1/0.0041,Acetyltransf_1/PF00583.19/0.011 TRINITY_DN20432_c0_g1_i1:30-320(+)
MAGIFIEHSATARRFIAKIKDVAAEGYLTYVKTGKILEFDHTYVPNEARGRGVGEHLCDYAFKFAQTEGFKVRPTCSYITGKYLPSHPEWNNIVEK